MQTHTQQESKRNQKKKPQRPSTTFDETLKLMATYVMAIKDLFGKYCSHFKQAIKLRKTFSALEERVEVLFTTNYAVLVWAMLEDGCQLFSTIVSRDDFEGNKLMADAKPEADLLNTRRMLRKTIPIKLATFPVQWESPVNSERQEPRGGYQGEHYRRRHGRSYQDGGGTANQEYQEGNPSHGRGYQGGQGGRRQGNKNGNPIGWFSGTHSQIRSIMMPYAREHPQLVFQAFRQDIRGNRTTQIPTMIDTRGQQDSWHLLTLHTTICMKVTSILPMKVSGLKE